MSHYADRWLKREKIGYQKLGIPGLAVGYAANQLNSLNDIRSLGGDISNELIGYELPGRLAVDAGFGTIGAFVPGFNQAASVFNAVGAEADLFLDPNRTPLEVLKDKPGEVAGQAALGLIGAALFPGQLSAAKAVGTPILGLGATGVTELAKAGAKAAVTKAVASGAKATVGEALGELKKVLPSVVPPDFGDLLELVQKLPLANLPFQPQQKISTGMQNLINML